MRARGPWQVSREPSSAETGSRLPKQKGSPGRGGSNWMPQVFELLAPKKLQSVQGSRVWKTEIVNSNFTSFGEIRVMVFHWFCDDNVFPSSQEAA